MLSGLNKQAEVKKLILALENDSNTSVLPVQELSSILAKLKIYSRVSSNADAIFCSAGIKTLSQYAFRDYPAEVSREACRCVANAMLLKPELRQDFVDSGYTDRTAELLKKQNDDDEFLMSRILFLLTYGTSLDIDKLVSSQDLPQRIEAHLRRHAVTFTGGREATSPISAMAIDQILKLSFNLSHATPKHITAFSSSTPYMVDILIQTPTPAPPLEPPVSSLINALAILDFPKLNADAISLGPPNKEFTQHLPELIAKLSDILDKSITIYSPAQLETTAVPLLTVLRKVYDIADEENKATMRRLLLPANERRDQPIGQGNDLPSRLLRLTTSTGQANLSECISGLMFELSDKDANKYVLNVGYGFAAGYLATHQISIPEAARAPAINSDSVPINPITGQRLDKEPMDARPEMTNEEKEREAERLFILFERLQATGVVDVENPVRQAMERGNLGQRVEELSDSD